MLTPPWRVVSEAEKGGGGGTCVGRGAWDQHPVKKHNTTKNMHNSSTPATAGSRLTCFDVLVDRVELSCWQKRACRKTRTKKLINNNKVHSA